MTWFKLDDQITEHPKFVGLPASAWALWLHGLAYSSRNATDGFIPHRVAVAMASQLCRDGVASVSRSRPDRVVAHLVKRDIWATVEGGYQIHDYTDHQRSKAEIEAIRAAARERKARNSKKVRANSGGPVDKGSRELTQPESETESETDHHQQTARIAETGSREPPDDDDDHTTVIHNHLRRWALANGKTNPVGYARSVIDNHAGEFDGIDGVELIQALDDRWPLNPKPRNGTAPTGAVDLGDGDIFLPGSGIVSTGEPERSLSAVAQAALREMGA